MSNLKGYITLYKKDNAPEDLLDEIFVSDFGLEEGGILYDRDTGEFYESSIYLAGDMIDDARVSISLLAYANSGNFSVSIDITSLYYELDDDSYDTLSYDFSQLNLASENS